MKAVAVFPQSRRIEMIDEPEPRVATPTEVKVRMLEVGICGTDKEIASFQYGTPPEGSDHLIIGHESLGRVVQAGAQVRDLTVGDLVVVMVRRPCPHAECVACRSGQQDFCYTGDYTERGIKGASGYMTEFVVDEERYMIPVPTRLHQVAVLTEPLTIAEKALEEIQRIQRRLPWGLPDRGRAASGYRHKAVVIGAGPVGLLGAMALAAGGFEIHVYSREGGDDLRAQVVKAVGGEYTCAAETPMDQFVAGVGNIDVIYEATGAAQISFDMLAYLGINAVFVFTGVPGRTHPFELDGDTIMRNLVLRNQVVLGTVNAPRKAYEAAVQHLDAFLERWPGAVSELISRHGMKDYQALLQGKMPGIKNVMVIGQGEGH
jgi:threonine dehydrogenase-like Zn-dependent dehydrogenase